MRAILLLVAFLLGALSHEADIQTSCSNKGMSGNSTWIHELKCIPIKG